MNVVWRVTLDDEKRSSLRSLVARGRSSAREIKRSQILLAADAGVRETEIERTVGVSAATIDRTKRLLIEERL